MTSQPSMSIGEFARKTGLSVRTLRFYETAGLIAPYRNPDNGRRYYAGGDLRRVQQVLALKMVGLTLSEIHALLTRQTMNPAAVLSLQLDLLVQRRDALDRAIASLRAALDRVDGDGDTAIDTLCSLIRMMKMVDDSNAYRDVINKYMTEEQIQGVHARNVPDETRQGYERQWAELIDEAERLVAEGADPASPAAQDVARRWTGLVTLFTQGDPSLMQSLNAMYQDRDNWPGGAEPPFSKAVQDFVGDAVASLGGAGD